MLLGPIVAISFATNLYFPVLLLSPPQQQPTTPISKEYRLELPKSALVFKPRK